jgi:hypothetical protein
LKLRKSLQFSLVAIGSMIPDLEEFGIMKKVHGRSEKFLQYLLEKDPKYVPLAIGMILHEELDKEIDKHHVSPHICNAEEILRQFDMDAEAAPYLIDHAVNCTVLEQEPEIIAVADKARKISHRHIHKISKHLADFFTADKKDVMNALHIFRRFNLRQYLFHDKASEVYMKFFFMKGRLKTANLWDKLKLAISYAIFTYKIRKNKVQEMCSVAKHKFKDHGKAYIKAQKALGKKLDKIMRTYSISLK